MTPHRILERFESTVAIWRDALDSYSDDGFASKPSDDAWSIGQVYYHLIVGTNVFHLQHIATCLDGKGTEMKGGKTLPGRIVFLIGGFPPNRVRIAPSERYTPKQPSSREEMKSGLQNLEAAMRTMAGRLESASSTMKSRHPALGFLNAMEWYSLIEMHFRHHLRQKKRLDHFLSGR